MPLSTADINATLKQLQQFALFGYISSSQIENVFDYADILGIYQIENNGIFKEEFFTPEHKLAVTSKISGKTINDYNDFATKIKEAMILTVVQNPNGFGNVKKVLEAHNAFIGIDTADTPDSVYRNLQNKNFSSIAALKEAFTKEKTGQGQNGQTTPGTRPGRNRRQPRYGRRTRYKPYH